MYESYYKLTEKPFSLLPDPDFLMLGRKHGMALAMLQYGLTNQAGFTVISGEIGCGKTTLIRHLLNVVGDEVTVGLISDTNQYQGELLRRIMLAFSQDFSMATRTGLFDHFTEFLIEEFAAGRRTVLIIDEAQNLEAETLEELRTLSNINADKAQILQLILVGQPELRDTLRRPELRQFAQRIAVDFHIQPLDADETASYIRHRLKVASGPPDLFDEQAMNIIHEFSGGVPRLINVVCDTALVYGFGSYQEHIDGDLVHEVIRDKTQSGLISQSAIGPWADGVRQSGDKACQEDRLCGGENSAPIDFGVPQGNHLPRAYVRRGKHVTCNTAYASLFGYGSADQLNGINLLELIAPEDRQLVHAMLEREHIESRISLNGLDAQHGVFPVELDTSPRYIDGESVIEIHARRIDVQAALSSRD